jgi:hypothetical protein
LSLCLLLAFSTRTRTTTSTATTTIDTKATAAATTTTSRRPSHNIHLQKVIQKLQITIQEYGSNTSAQKTKWMAFKRRDPIRIKNCNKRNKLL